MARSREPVNPFYVLVAIVGVVFLVTACAYGVMAFRAISTLPDRPPESHALTSALDRHGVVIMTWELALLAVTTLAAMGLDRFRSLRQQAARGDERTEKGDREPDGQVR
jgi:hypothetical protein